MAKIRIRHASVSSVSEVSLDLLVAGELQVSQLGDKEALQLKLIVRDSQGWVLATQTIGIDGGNGVVRIAERVRFDDDIALAAEVDVWAIATSETYSVMHTCLVEDAVGASDMPINLICLQRPRNIQSQRTRVVFDTHRSRWVLARVLDNHAQARALFHEASTNSEFPSHHVRLSTALTANNRALLMADVNVQRLYRMALIGFDDHGPVVDALAALMRVPRHDVRFLVGRLHAPPPPGQPAKAEWTPRNGPHPLASAVLSSSAERAVVLFGGTHEKHSE